MHGVLNPAGDVRSAAPPKPSPDPAPSSLTAASPSSTRASSTRAVKASTRSRSAPWLAAHAELTRPSRWARIQQPGSGQSCLVAAAAGGWGGQRQSRGTAGGSHRPRRHASTRHASAALSQLPAASLPQPDCLRFAFTCSALPILHNSPVQTGGPSTTAPASRRPRCWLRLPTCGPGWVGVGGVGMDGRADRQGVRWTLPTHASHRH